ncbi:MAG: putative DNA binding domain-containing protein [Pontibacter sp.]|nr:putative DNA binding domain-containing protein [Pontibacter sp.]
MLNIDYTFMSESQNVEWKASWRDEYLKWICGFANAKGGRIIIGKDDDGRVVGVADFRRLMEDIPNKVQNHLGIICDVNLHEEEGRHFIEIVVPPYDVPISYQGKYHYRSGSTKQELTGASLNNFLLRKAGRTWDDVVEPSATLKAIGEEGIAAFKRGAVSSKRLPSAADDSTEELLENLRLTQGGELKRAALLLFAKDPRAFFPNAYVKIGRFGSSDADLLFQDVVEGNAFQLADLTLEVLEKKYFTSPISYQGLQRVESSEYPYEALREILLNAIVHRTYTTAPVQISIYNDRLIVWNEGSLPDNLSVEDLKRKHPSLPRNPVLADACFKGGLIEAWGRGTVKIMEECQRLGLPEPDITTIGGGVSVTLFKDIYAEEQLKGMGLNERQVEALLLWKNDGRIQNSKYKEKFSITDRTALRDLTDLVDKGLLSKEGEKKSTVYVYKGRNVG